MILFTFYGVLDCPTVLSFYVIYRQPSDFPDSFVCRSHRLLPCGRSEPRHLVSVAPDLETVRAMLPRPGLARVERHPQDDPVIVETWL